MFAEQVTTAILFAVTLIVGVMHAIVLSTLAAHHRDLEETRIRLAKARLAIHSLLGDIRVLAEKNGMEMEQFDGLLDFLATDTDGIVREETQWLVRNRNR
jgi:hypothetical protein